MYLEESVLLIVSSIRRYEGEVNFFLDTDAVALAKELDGLPLVLATAGAYLDQVPTSFSDYLCLYRASWLKLQQTSPEVSSYDQALYSTWQLSFDHVKQKCERSAKLLQLWAYFDNDDIWFELLRHGNSSNLAWFSGLIEDELSFNQAMRVLCNHGLAELDASSEERIESGGYSMHNCVHSWTIHVLNQEWDYEMADVALECVGSHVPDDASPKSWVTQRRLVGHAARSWYMLSNDLVRDEGMEWAVSNLGSVYYIQGKLGEAEQMYQRALQGKEKALGPDHTSTLDTVNNLGNLYHREGKLGEAEQMYAGAARVREGAGT